MLKPLHESGHTMLLCGAMRQPWKLLQGARFQDRVGREKIMPNVQAGFDRAQQIHSAQVRAGELTRTR